MNEIQGRTALLSILGQTVLKEDAEEEGLGQRTSITHAHGPPAQAAEGVREQMHTGLSLIVTVYDEQLPLHPQCTQ